MIRFCDKRPNHVCLGTFDPARRRPGADAVTQPHHTRPMSYDTNTLSQAIVTMAVTQLQAGLLPQVFANQQALQQQLAQVQQQLNTSLSQIEQLTKDREAHVKEIKALREEVVARRVNSAWVGHDYEPGRAVVGPRMPSGDTAPVPADSEGGEAW